MTEVKFVFEGDPRKLAAALKEVSRETVAADKEVNKLGADAQKAGDKGARGASTMKTGMVAVAAAAAAATLAVKGTLSAITQMTAQANQYAKQAKQLGTSAEEIQKIEGAFGLLTAGGADAVTSITKLQRSIAEAQDGVETYTDAFSALGIKGADAVEQFAGLTVTQQIEAIADGMAGIEKTSTKTQVAMDLLGRSGALLVPALQNGSQAFRDTADSIERAGLVSNETAARAEQLQDSLDLMRRSAQTLVYDVLAPAIPVLTDVATELGAIIQEARDSGEIDELGESFAEVATSVGQTVTALADMKEVLGPVFALLTKNTRDAIEDVGWLSKQFKEARKQAKFYAGELGVSADVLDDVNAATDRAAETTGYFFGELLTPVRKAKDGYADLAEAIHETAAAAKTPEEIIAETSRKTIGAIDDVTLATLAAQEKQTEAEREALDERLKNRVRMVEDSISLDEMYADYMKSKAAENAKIIHDSYMSTLDSLAALSGSITDLIIGDGKRLTKEQKAAAMAMWAVQSAASIASVIVLGIENTQRAIAAGLQIGGPQGLALGIAAGVAFAANAAGAVAAAAAAKPSFHGGTDYATGPREFRATLEEGEAVVSRRGMDQPGARETVNALNRGDSDTGDRVIAITKVDNTVTFAAEYQAIRTGRSPYLGEIEKARAQRVGLRAMKGT